MYVYIYIYIYIYIHTAIYIQCINIIYIVYCIHYTGGQVQEHHRHLLSTSPKSRGSELCVCHWTRGRRLLFELCARKDETKGQKRERRGRGEGREAKGETKEKREGGEEKGERGQEEGDDEPLHPSARRGSYSTLPTGTPKAPARIQA